MRPAPMIATSWTAVPAMSPPHRRWSRKEVPARIVSGSRLVKDGGRRQPSGKATRAGHSRLADWPVHRGLAGRQQLLGVQHQLQYVPSRCRRPQLSAVAPLRQPRIGYHAADVAPSVRRRSCAGRRGGGPDSSRRSKRAPATAGVPHAPGLMTAKKPCVAHLAGPDATIQNTPPLITSNKARAKSGLPLLTNPDGTAQRCDALRPQRLAAPATVYVEQFSAHPLEADAAELYGPPDGYLDAEGRFQKTRRSASDRPVYEIEIRPQDGLYPLP